MPVQEIFDELRETLHVRENNFISLNNNNENASTSVAELQSPNISAKVMANSNNNAVSSNNTAA